MWWTRDDVFETNKIIHISDDRLLKGVRIQPNAYFAPNDVIGIRTNLEPRPISSVSKALEWHKIRRRKMLFKHGEQISRLENDESSFNLAMPLLVFANMSLSMLSF
mmetsp:Transcript_28273/g.28636  ORF Transcript_28273/g.28636 Transcript_28273/m.28636 type:complete len:106 (-) Transcript_28273:49-366(-)